MKMEIFFLALIAVIPYPVVSKSYIWCEGQPADILFLLDSSTSVHRQDYKKQLDFINKTVSIFPISQTEIRIGVSIFSHHYYRIFGFERYSNKERLQRAILRVPMVRGNTWTFSALRMVRLRALRRARKDVPKIVIVITDGLSSNPKETAKQADLLKKTGAYVFAIGIGAAGDPKRMTELTAIGSDPPADFVYEVASYSVLDKIMESLTYKACRVQSSDILPYCSAKRPTDIIFAYDAEAMGAYNGKFVNDFICNTTGYFGNMNDGSLRAGVMEGQCETRDIYLDDFNSKQDLITELRRKTQSSRSLDEIVSDMCNEGYNETNGGRVDAKKVAVIFVDHTVKDMDDIVTEIVLARAKNIEVYVVVIGDDIETESLREVVDEPIDKHLTVIENHKALINQQQLFSAMLCEQIENIPPKETDKYVDVDHSHLGSL